MKQSVFMLLIFIIFFSAFSQSKSDADAKQKVIQADKDCDNAVLAVNTKEIQLRASIQNYSRKIS